VAGLARRLTNLTQSDLDQVMKFAAFLEFSHQADVDGDDEHVPDRGGAAS
jgi:hypothetical protein